MPYEVAFTKRVPLADPESYINECCWGGDAVTAQLLPSISSRYEKIQCNQEDWGWFIWFRKGSIKLAIDVTCDDPEVGEFRLHLTSRRPRWGFLSRVVDTPELEDLRALVLSELSNWGVTSCAVSPLDWQYMPLREEGKRQVE